MQTLYVLPHHVHPHSPPRGAGDHRAGGDPRGEDQPHGLIIAHHIHVLRPDQARFQSRLLYFLDVDPCPIVGHFDDDVAALLEGCYSDRPSARFTRSLAIVRSFDAVINRVAQQVNEGVLDLLQHLSVQLRLRPFYLQAYVFALLPGQVAHHAGQGVEDGGDGQHADLHHPLSQVGRHAGEVKGIAGETSPQVAGVGDQAL